MSPVVSIIVPVYNAAATLRVTLLDGAEDILTDLLAAQNDYEQLCRADLTDEEAAQYATLHARVMARVRDALW